MSKLWILSPLILAIQVLGLPYLAHAQSPVLPDESEIELTGTAYPSSSGVGVMFLEAKSMTKPDGTTLTFKTSRDKTVLISTSTDLNHSIGDFSFEGFGAGDTVSVIGKDLGTGKPLIARVISTVSRSLEPNSINILENAIRHDDIALLAKGISDGIDINSRDIENDEFTPLMFAVREHKEDCVSVLIKNGASINATDPVGSTALQESVLEGDYKIASELISAGANVNTLDSSLNYPASFAHGSLLQLLKHAGAIDNPKMRANQLLFIGVDFGDLSMINKALSDGADVNARNFEGMSALMMASDVGDVNAVETLLKDGTPVNSRSLAGLTALDYAKMRSSHSNGSDYHDCVSSLQNAGGMP